MVLLLRGCDACRAVGGGLPPSLLFFKHKITVRRET